MSRLVFGLQPVRETLRAHGARVAKIYLQADGGPALEALGRFAVSSGAVLERVSRAALDRLSEGGRHQGAAAEAPELRLWDVEDLALGPDAAVTLLDGVTDPQNFGATIRSAVALGTGEVVFGEHGAAPLTPATFRASAGAVEHARLVRARSLHGAVATLVECGLTVVALDPAASALLGDHDLSGPAAVVVGAEDRGVSRAVKRACSALARLPMSDRVGSLNASVAAAIALYEVRRQRGRDEAQAGAAERAASAVDGDESTE
ncbi:MAG: RNA methyltransferase [Myxococcales bacterium]|nr:RNA methyltransferase [Myxococcales bacterium]